MTLGIKAQEDYTHTLCLAKPPGKALWFLGLNEHVRFVILWSNVRILYNYLAWEITSIESACESSGVTSAILVEPLGCVPSSEHVSVSWLPVIVTCSDSDCFAVCSYPQAFCYVLLPSSQHFEPSVYSNWSSGGTWTLDQSCQVIMHLWLLLKCPRGKHCFLKWRKWKCEAWAPWTCIILLKSPACGIYVKIDNPHYYVERIGHIET